MRYCKQCNVKIADPTTLCPLCQSVLETPKEKDETKKSMYPMIGLQRKG